MTGWNLPKFAPGGRSLAVFLCLCGVAGCATLPSPPPATSQEPEYQIGAGDTLQILVWHNPDLTAAVPVRPDGRVSVPLVDDVQAEGQTPTQLADVITKRLEKFVSDPTVTVIVTSFVGPYSQQVRIVGEAQRPAALNYRKGMTALDAMIAVGGLTQYAAGDRATLVRSIDGKQERFTLRLADLLEDGDISANTALEPGDIIIIPQTFF